MYKIIYCSNNSPLIPNYWINAFRNNSNFKLDIIFQWDSRNKPKILEKIFEKLKFPIDFNNYNYGLIKKTISFMPDIIFIEKGWYIYPWTLKKLKRINKNLKIIYFSNDNMNLDNNVVYHFKSSLKKNLYDYLYFINIDKYKGLEKNTKSKVYYIDKSYCTRTHYYNNFANQDLVQKFDVTFIGTFENDRYKKMLNLASFGIRIDIFGHGWSKIKEHKNIKIHNYEIIGDDYIKTVLQSKINLGFLRKANFDTQTSRSLEIFMMGGFMLMEKTNDHIRMYGDQSKKVLFENDEKLIYLIKLFINDYKFRKKVIHLIQKNILNLNLSYDDKVKLIYSNLKNIN